MQVSVIIPVYNAEKFVAQAVESCLMQPETGEVILVEDASPDKSLAVCEKLESKYRKVRLFRNNDRQNLGAGASRNRGIREATCKYIAFLDADDYFLPGRFSVAAHLFEDDLSVDGVYEAVGVQFEDEAAERRWRYHNHDTMMATMKERVRPEHLFQAQSPVGNWGYCPTGGWVIKRSVFDKTGLFDDDLRFREDTVMYIKFAAVCRMVPGRLEEPVAIWRRHGKSLTAFPPTDREDYDRDIKMWGTLWQWGKRNLNKYQKQLLLRAFIATAARPYKAEPISQLRQGFITVGHLTELLLTYPDLCFEKHIFYLFFDYVKRKVFV